MRGHQSRGLMYARRLKGDLDLGLELARIQGDITPAWARSDFPGGQLPGGVGQAVYEATTHQNYRIGTRRIEFGRTFRYSYAGADLKTIGNEARLLINGNLVPATTVETGGWEGTPGLAVAGAINDRYLDIADDNVRAAHFYQGGYLIVFYGPAGPAIPLTHQYFIVDSDEAEAADDFVRCYLDEKVYGTVLPADVTVGVGAYRSPYSNVTERLGGASLGYQAFIGVVHCLVEAERWFWLQTGGPCWITPQENEEPGNTTLFRDVYAHVDGTIGSANILALGHQRVGYVLGSTANGHGDGFIMLQLDAT